MKQTTHPAILSIGGLDPSGGAGILADAVAARAVGVHAAAVMTVDTIQNGGRFISARLQDASSVRLAVEAVLGSMRIGAIKTGALGNADIVGVVLEFARRASTPPIVVDPVIASTSGGILLDSDGVRLLKEELLRKTSLVTPNLREASILTGEEVKDVPGMLRAAGRLVELGAGAALVKGGHLQGREIADVFMDKKGRKEVFETVRSDNCEVRGTGCALASLVAALISKGFDVIEAVAVARRVLSRAISDARKVGQGPRVLDFSGSVETVRDGENDGD